MVARSSNARCMFDSCWLELTSLKMANHGPQKLRHNPVAWSVTVYATHSYQFVLKYAIGKCNWVLDRVQIKDSEPKVQTQVPRGREVDQDFPRRDFPFHPRLHASRLNAN